jgi:chemotaxis protein methyltransferase CheR
MNATDFEVLSQTLKRRSGLVLTADKGYLVESRLAPIIQKLGLDGPATIIAKLRAGDEAVARAVTEAMTTNESFFFRDQTPFDLFEKVMLASLVKARAGKRKLSIWCAAASTGQEPYSLAMIVRENSALLKDWSVEILGTDISHEVIARAKSGLFSHFEVQRGLPIQLLVKYFAKKDEQWCLKDEIRKMVQFRAFNLLDPYLGLGSFDIVFCRNVLIYFDEATKKNVLERIAQLMPDDGYLVLGGAESVFGVTNVFAPVEGTRGLYQRRAAASATRAAPIAVAGGARA